MTWHLETDHPIAVDSLDHLYPVGTADDNYKRGNLNVKLYRLLHKHPISVLDLGCAGGGFVQSLIEDGHIAVGLVVAGWRLLQPPDHQAVPGRAAPLPPDAPRLALIGELDAEARKALEKLRGESAPAAAPASVADGPPPTGLLCVAVGPFDDRAVADALAEKLRTAGVLEVREESGQLRSGYWVHLRPFPSREAAEKAAADLAQKRGGRAVHRHRIRAAPCHLARPVQHPGAGRPAGRRGRGAGLPAPDRRAVPGRRGVLARIPGAGRTGLRL